MAKISFFISLGFYVCLLLLNYPRPNLGGDSAMGYGLGLAFLGLGFAIGSIGLFVGLTKAGVFSHLVKDRFLEIFLAVSVWLSFVLTVFFSAALRWENNPEMVTFLEWFVKVESLIWFPPLVFIPAFLVFFLGNDVSSLFVKSFFSVGFLFSMLFALGLLIEWVSFQNKQQKEFTENAQIQDQDQHDRNLQTIEASDSSQSVILILPFSGRFHEEDIKAAAVAKIKSRPDWESELIGILVSDYYYNEVYTFLDGNPVDHPNLFTEPIRLSILKMAEDIRNAITDSNNLQEWQFEYLGIERLLRAIDEQFSGLGTDFRPALLEVRKALDTAPPERFKGVKYSITPVLDQWLKNNPH